MKSNSSRLQKEARRLDGSGSQGTWLKRSEGPVSLTCRSDAYGHALDYCCAEYKVSFTAEHL